MWVSFAIVSVMNKALSFASNQAPSVRSIKPPQVFDLESLRFQQRFQLRRPRIHIPLHRLLHIVGVQ